MLYKQIKSTTILCIAKKNHIVIGGDGQATIGDTILKNNVIKIKPIRDKNILTGFAGSTADAFSLFEKLEQKIEFYHNNIERAAVELIKELRTNKMMGKLEAMIVVANEKIALIISGSGDVISSDNKGILAIGSGANFARAAAHALISNTKLSLSEIVKRSLIIAAETCIYTNHNVTIEELIIN